jgi:2Fe-2S ferredoxin
VPHVTYVAADGARTTLDVPDGTSLMMAACDEGLRGIVGECGGNAMCATCHVYVDVPWLAKLAAKSEEEDALLDGTAAERRPNSRLSCQIFASAALDGIVVEMPDRQV